MNGILLSGLLARSPGQNAALVSHPHPHYGGDMHNHVVGVATRAYARAGCTTFRFNFRASDGANDDDLSQSGCEDVAAAVKYLAQEGKTAIELIGYSFGAWIYMLALPLLDHVRNLISISPPVALLDFSAVQPSEKLRLIIAGEHDPWAPPAQIEKLIPAWNPAAVLKVVAGEDHFFGADPEAIALILGDFIESVSRSPQSRR